MKNVSVLRSFLTPYTISFPAWNLSTISSMTSTSSCRSASMEMVTSLISLAVIRPAVSAN